MRAIGAAPEGSLAGTSGGRINSRNPVIVAQLELPAHVLEVLRAEGTDPKYVHAVELIPDIDVMTRSLLEFIVAVERARASGPIDLNFFLERGERDHVNAVLDEHSAEQLARVRPGGHA